MEFLAVDPTLLLEKFLLIAIVVLALLGIALYTTFAERKVAGVLQDRHGPNRAGPFGLLQPLADGIKLFFKEEVIPLSANKVLFVLGPSLAMFTAMIPAAPKPCAARAAMSRTSESESVVSTEADPHKMAPVKYTRRYVMRSPQLARGSKATRAAN